MAAGGCFAPPVVSTVDEGMKIWATGGGGGRVGRVYVGRKWVHLGHPVPFYTGRDVP